MHRAVRLAPLLIALAAGPALGDIRIAAIAPMSGPYQALGQQIRAGVEKAVADLNAKGGIHGEKIRLDVDDDPCKADVAAAAANRAAGRGDVLVVGHICAVPAEAAASVYAADGIVAITPGVTAAGYSDRRAGPTIFRLAARDDAQAAVAGSYLATTFPKARIAFLNDGSPYGKAIADATRLAMNAAGKKEARNEPFESGAKEYSRLAARLADDEIDVVFIGAYHGDIALIAQALRDQGSKAIVMGGDALGTSEYGEAAGDSAEGTLLTFPTDWRTAPSAASVVASFRADGVEPQGYTLPAYAAVQIWAAARTAAGPKGTDVKGPDVAAKIAAGDTPTVLGPVGFDAKGDAKLPGFSVYRWTNGTFAPLPGS